MSNPIFVRQTYTLASLFGLIPAIIFAAADYNTHSVTRAITAAPFYYLFVCQLLIVSRYTLVAYVVSWFDTYRWFNWRGGMVGMLTAGLIFDTWLILGYSSVLSSANPDIWPGIVPLVGVPLGLLYMLPTAIIGGAMWHFLSGKQSPSKPKKKSKATHAKKRK